jgi:hypothetical protein
MLSKLIVFGAGYVLGAKAGRDRYNQIVAIAQEAARRLEGYGGDSRLRAGGRWASSRANSRGSDQSKA